MTQGRLSKVKKFRISPEEAKVLANKVELANMTESEYLRLMISQKPNDYPKIRILLKELILIRLYIIIIPVSIQRMIKTDW